ncbi:hypothetical protein [Exiguobacterium chiriqhucha]|uniref:Uncharacterized protein n=1 Tax=Exiguobacterium chiriqhucha RW-2 TaxID=1345023 RepID=U1N276_9BACL|nr:hypothetical protein [Exiguobacterium chiriqhucha]ERG68071.1 hypothetical protein M467_12345 [Exiguobacterium chiriqhucha RW-2]
MKTTREIILVVENEMRETRSNFETQVLKHAQSSDRRLQDLLDTLPQGNQNEIEKQAIQYLLATRNRSKMLDNTYKQQRHVIQLECVPLLPLDFETNVDRAVDLGIKAWEDGMAEVALMYFDEVIEKWALDMEDDVVSLYYALVNRFRLLKSLFNGLNREFPVAFVLRDMMHYQQLMTCPTQREYRYSLIQHIAQSYYETDREYDEYILLKNEAIALIETRLRDEPYLGLELYTNQMMNQYFDLGNIYIQKLNDAVTGRRYLSYVLKSDLSETSSRVLTREYDLFRKGQTHLLLKDIEQAKSLFDELLIRTDNKDWPILVDQQLRNYDFDSMRSTHAHP